MERGPGQVEEGGGGGCALGGCGGEAGGRERRHPGRAEEEGFPATSPANHCHTDVGYAPVQAQESCAREVQFPQQGQEVTGCHAVADFISHGISGL